MLTTQKYLNEHVINFNTVSLKALYDMLADDSHVKSSPIFPVCKKDIAKYCRLLQLWTI